MRWLLELARSSENDLSTFAQRMLLESFEPGDFSDGDSAKGVARLWELAVAIGASGREVLLVDLDRPVPAPDAARRAPAGCGLADVLAGAPWSAPDVRGTWRRTIASDRKTSAIKIAQHVK